MKLKKSLLAATFAFTAIANAQEANKFSLSGEFRPRTEWFGHGQSKTAATGSKGFLSTSVRAALKATYKTEGYTLFTSFQEVFKFGDRTQINAAGNGNFRVQEAWADIKLGETSTLKIGRQPLSYDDQRILGGLGWAQQARTHDAGVFKYKSDGYSLDLGVALNTPTSSVYNSAKNFSYREMAFARANKKYGDFNISALVLANTFQDSASTITTTTQPNDITTTTDVLDLAGNVIGSFDTTTTPAKITTTTSKYGDNKSTLITAGLHADYKVDALSFSANAYIQDGKRVGDTDVKGKYLASLSAKYKATEKTTFGLGYESISGKEDDSAGFFPVYGTNHAFNGLMDRFYVGNHAKENGLNDAQASVSTKAAGLAITLTGHYFTEQSQTKDDLGSELDLVVAKGFKGYKLVGGYSQFFEPSGITGAKDSQNWAWLMLIISPKFL